ncbi:MAG: hypothetical protein ACUVRS_05485 [Armatimonadota bacterium]
MRLVFGHAWRIYASWFAFLLVAILLTGCAREPGGSVANSGVVSKSERRSGAKPTPLKGSGQPVESDRPKGLPSLRTVVKRVTLQWTSDNKMSLSASASRLEGSELSRKVILTDLNAKLYQDGKLAAELVAPKVEADERKRILTATGGVTLKSLDGGTVLTCEWMKWFARENRIVGNGGVKVVSRLESGDRYKMEGAAFEADTALKSIAITDAAKGWIGK